VIAAMVFLCAVRISGGTAKTLDGVVKFVNGAVGELTSSPLQIPQFEAAAVDTIEDLGRVDDVDRYLCWLKNDQGRTGYVAVACRGNSCQILAFSGTLGSPAYLLRQLHTAAPSGQQDALSFQMVQEFLVEGIPLVAAGEVVLAQKQSIEVSETACSLAGIFRHLQNEKRLLLFGNGGHGRDPEYVRRFTENPAGALVFRDPNWVSFKDESREAIMRENIDLGEMSREKASLQLQQHRIVKPILRRRLLNPRNAWERMQLLGSESAIIANLTAGRESQGVKLLTEGMKSAVLLQEHYLGREARSLHDNLALFLATRGRMAPMEVVPFRHVPEEELPAMIRGPDSIAGILLGYVRVGGERFAMVYFPRTGAPLMRTLAEKRRAYRVEKGLPAEPAYGQSEEASKLIQRVKDEEERVRKLYEEKGLPNPLPDKPIEQRLQESMERMKAADEAMKVVEDRSSKFPECLSAGVHLIRCSRLTTWQVLQIGEIGVGDNWGQSPSETNP
jgi:hypothetical protein